MQEILAEESREERIGHKTLTQCPYCRGGLTKKGIRKKKFEDVQIYFCGHCSKKITPMVTKHKTYPLRVVIDALIMYNRLNPVEKIPAAIKEKYGIDVTPRTISGWLREYSRYAPFLRMREFAKKKFERDAIEETKLFHNQIYNFKYHRAKLSMILDEEFRHSRFRPLREFLELAAAECPHHIFQSSDKRASEYKNVFNLGGVKIVPKDNTAVKIANFVMQAVSNNKFRHEMLEEFMIANDTVTVASEVAVLIGDDDLMHFKHELNFDIPISLNDGEYITGHIDMIQVRNGSVCIMDFKPSAAKERPIDQLTLYALALSRLTGIRLYHMKCAWFDDRNYYEFFPLHVVYKMKKGRRIPRDQRRLEDFEKDNAETALAVPG
ncbi:MAG: PD-(D/E)XK nuclease family protein [Candidatus Aenigmarchaeota archaeon]|nr:PD-(D/E)XK nuclease family protein [Candidatus Aenigmarchaeota archaeon]MDI6722558.1 PD-(D/E)XK nuclease family protein [Candidatus Aenigmarchaeota archaeon]